MHPWFNSFLPISAFMCVKEWQSALILLADYLLADYLLADYLLADYLLADLPGGTLYLCLVMGYSHCVLFSS